MALVHILRKKWGQSTLALT